MRESVDMTLMCSGHRNTEQHTFILEIRRPQGWGSVEAFVDYHIKARLYTPRPHPVPLHRLPGGSLGHMAESHREVDFVLGKNLLSWSITFCGFPDTH